MPSNKPHEAFGHPGIEPKWTVSAKDGVGTAYAASSEVWFTLALGVVNEVYFPTLDRPQIRDLQYLITDGETFCHDEKRDLDSEISVLSPHALGFRITNSDPKGRYRIIKDIISDPHQDVVLTHTTLEGDEDFLERIKLYALLAPHLGVGGWGNSGEVREIADREVLAAHKNGTWLALGATVPFRQCSCGFVGESDGWTDLKDNFQLDWHFDTATDGNIALTGEIDLSQGHTFTLGLAFGNGFHSAVTALFQSLDAPFEQRVERFIEQWERTCDDLIDLTGPAGDDGQLYDISHSLLLAHEDKTYQGAMIASLSIPWGEAKSDDDLGGYHLVWTRDMYNSVTGLLATGNTETATRALIYLACSQRDDGGFPQNFWLDGTAYWSGIQLDGVAFPVMLAWRLHKADVLGHFDPYPMMLKAARYLIVEGPATPQERWEENSGYSPSTLASNIAALTCTAAFARERGDDAIATFIQDYADFLESHVEAWTVTTEGTLVEDIPRHYIRINPIDPDNPRPDESPNTGILSIRNRPPGTQVDFPAKDIVDAGFLELVRYGIRAPGDPLIEDSLRVVDAVLKVETPVGPCWHRYNHDGYGQRDDGGPFTGWGTGRAWPLLTGERGHYELAAGCDPTRYIEAMEGFANACGLLPEQVWDTDDLPEKHLFLGRPAGAAMPLMWAHAEYAKLLRSARDGAVFDLIPCVAEYYLTGRERPRLDIWKFNRQVRHVAAGTRIRILSPVAFRLRWSTNGWQDQQDTDATGTHLGISCVDLPAEDLKEGDVRFTFYWTEAERWEGRDFQITVVEE